MTPRGSENINPGACAAVIVSAFINYNEDFRRITRRAKRRFETRDWSSNHKDAVERIELYENSVARTVSAVKGLAAHDIHDKSLWALIKEQYSSQIQGSADTEFFKTYYSSITRQIFSTIGVDPLVEFIAPDAPHLCSECIR